MSPISESRVAPETSVQDEIEMTEDEDSDLHDCRPTEKDSLVR